MKFYIVDVFAEAKYQGNQLAVLIPEKDQKLTKEEMLKVAKEIGFSETTFIMSGKQPNGGYDVRIFTPDIEVPFAGHPTLGTAYIINKVFEGGKADKVILNLGVGQIPVVMHGEELTMSQNQPEFGMIIEDRKWIADILSINEEDIRTDLPIQLVSTGLPCFAIPLRTNDAIERCRINHPVFKKFIEEVYGCNMAAFCEDGKGGLHERVFMEDTGYFEDPATGSANGNLAGYFLHYGYFGNKENIEYEVTQGVEMGRPSKLKIIASCKNGSYSIDVGGKVYPVVEGEWL